MQGLEGVRVLEPRHMVSASYATKLMADLGADVIKVEEPGGDREPASEGPFRRGPLTLSKAGSFCISIPTSAHVPDRMDERVEGGRSLSRRAGSAHLFCAGFIHVSPRPTGTVARQTLLCRCAPSPCWDAQAPRRTLPAP